MAQTGKKPSDVDACYQRLHEAIVRGTLSPNQRLVELELAEQWGVGRATVRTVLDRLVQDGLVEHLPNRGARVRKITVEEAIEMYEARAVIEGLAARYAAQRATAADVADLQQLLDEMAQALAAGDLLAFSALNARFHAQILHMSNHRTATRLLERLQAQHVHFQYRMILVPGRAAHSMAEHRTIVAAIAAHNGAAAESAMCQHLTHTADTLRQNVQVIAQGITLS